MLPTILKDKQSIKNALASGTLAQHKKVTQPIYEELDKAVCTWLTDKRAKNAVLSGTIMQQKALNDACMPGLDNFKASTGWLNRFKAWHNIIGKVLYSESTSADTDGTSA